MSDAKATLPLTSAQVIDMYFMEHRAKLIDIAAFLDRVERADATRTASDDFRMQAFNRGVRLLLDGQPHRARRVLESFSDPTTAPIAKAPMKGALGVFKGEH